MLDFALTRSDAGRGLAQGGGTCSRISIASAHQVGAAGFWRRPLVPAGAAGAGQRPVPRALIQRLEADGFEVVPGDEVIWQNDIAVRNGRRLAAENVDVVIFNFSVWAWPQFARVAGQFCPQPIVMFSDGQPAVPGPGRHAGQRRLARRRRASASRRRSATSPTTGVYGALRSQIRRGRGGAPADAG